VPKATSRIHRAAKSSSQTRLDGVANKRLQVFQLIAYRDRFSCSRGFFKKVFIGASNLKSYFPTERQFSSKVELLI